MDTLVHNQYVIKNLLKEIGEYKDSKYHYHCLKSINMLLDGHQLLELLCKDVYYTYKGKKCYYI